MTDRLDAIKTLFAQHDAAAGDPTQDFPYPCGCDYYETPCLGAYDDARWLVAEVERLREHQFQVALWDGITADKRIQQLEADLAALRERIYEDNAVCLCGCPAAAHEVCDEGGGESCDNGDHTCIRVCNAAAQEFAALRERHATVEAAYVREHKAHSDLLGILSEFFPPGADIRECLVQERQRHADAETVIEQKTNLWMQAEAEIVRLRERHAEAVEAAYKEAITRANPLWFPTDEIVHAAWLASETKARLT